MKDLRIELKWALIFSGMILGWMVLEKALGLHGANIASHQKFAPFVLVPALLIYVLAQLDARRTRYHGTMTYGGGVKSGLVLTAWVVAVSPFTTVLLARVISPDFFAQAARHAVQSGVLTEAEAATQFSLKNFIVTGIVGGVVTGALFSALVAAFTRKKAATTQP